MEYQKFASYFETIVRGLGMVVVVAGLVGTFVEGAETSVPAPSPTVAQSAASVGDVEEGEELWVNYYCYSCHGWSGNGASGPPVSNTDRTLESFIRYVRNPARMPPYVNKVMTDRQLTDVYAFLLSIPQSPSMDSIPMLNDVLD